MKLFFGLCAFVLVEAASLAVTTDTRTYETPYYQIRTDADLDTVREAAVRLTATYEAYRAITKTYSKNTPNKLRVCLCKNEQDFITEGGVANAGGQYSSKEILIRLDFGDHAWRTAQHECWHQFTHEAIADDLPPWVSEGTAEYFERGVWTGSSLRTGRLSDVDLNFVQQMIKGGTATPFRKMMSMGRGEWNNKFANKKMAEAQRNYLQAWSMVYFLWHGDNGKYKQGFDAYMLDLSRSQHPLQSFIARLGDPDQFQQAYAKWWMSLSRNPSNDLRAEIAAETMTSYLARGYSQGQRFEMFDDFLAQAREGKIQMKQDLLYWLPPALIKKTAAEANAYGKWRLDTATTLPQIVLTRPDGKVCIGSFTLPKDHPPLVQMKAAGESDKNQKNEPASIGTSKAGGAAK